MEGVDVQPVADSSSSPSNSSEDGARSTTPATSPSLNSNVTSPDLKLSNHSSLSIEAADFLSTLDNYLALGCLCFEDLADTEQPSNDLKWQDVARIPLLLGCDINLASDLSKLLQSGWIRIQARQSAFDRRFLLYRIYLLPGDIGHRFIDRQKKRLSVALENLLPELDISQNTWQGRFNQTTTKKRFDLWATGDNGSLFYMFNKLPSPSPSGSLVEEKYAREALEDLLDPASVLPGLRTVLYPYQRRSAGLMLQRESTSNLELDPRLESRTAPDGSTFYYGARDLLFLKYPRYYETCRGGILAETMGLGKTVILLAMILATKNHLPRVPSAYNLPSPKPKVARLADMVVRAINRKSIPWQVEFDRIRHATGEDMRSCMERLEASPAGYEIPMEPARWNRKTILPEPKKMTMAATTLIVVPRNLCKQWQSEISKHTEEGALRVLIMEDLKRALPHANDLRTYDIVLFSRNRFEIEIRDGADEQGRRLAPNQLVCRCPYIGATRTRDCNCVRSGDLYDSPLKHLHFKRLIIDEGHFFSNNNTNAVAVANKLIETDHRWVVSGTPARDLLGVEVDMSSAENLWHTPDTDSCRNAVLEQRRTFSFKEDTGGAVKSLGILASHFLKIRPWHAAELGEQKADWEDYIYRHESLQRRTFSSFSSCLQRTLEAMVIKTQPEDVERDIELPPLSHEVVRLEPSFFDKLTANLFTLVLTANAVTSERTDADYLFHKNSQKARYQLISNLRQSAFFWTGFSEDDVLASVRNSNGYLAKEGTGCTAEDRKLLIDTVAFADTILASSGWNSMSKSHEVGLFVDDWPLESAEHWAFDQSYKPLLTGISQLSEAQRHVNERTGSGDPGEGLSGAGIRALASARHGAARDEDRFNKKATKPILDESRHSNIELGWGAKGSPTSLKQSFKVVKSRKSRMPPLNLYAPPMKVETDIIAHSHKNATSSAAASDAAPPSRKRRGSELQDHELPPESAYLQSRIVGTTSAKLSYLISQIVKYSEDEKILVFYDGDNVAYYIAQALELLHIKHEIYAKSLAAHLKSEYVVRFDQQRDDRVLLMDVKQAAFGLNLSSASRIYFVNPVCRPNIEAQAIKRAHRIGQTRKVSVETLVLKGTVEEKMLERSRRMTRAEHLDAKVLEDDGGIREIIQSARLLSIGERESSGYGQMAPLEEPQQLWGRTGWRATVSSASKPRDRRKRQPATFDDVTDQDEDAGIVHERDGVGTKVKRRMVAFVDCKEAEANARVIEDDSDDEPVAVRWRRVSVGSASTPAPLAATKGYDSLLFEGFGSPIDSQSRFQYLESPAIEPVSPPPQSTRAPAYPRISMSQLMDEDVGEMMVDRKKPADLLREIISRL